MRNINYNYLNGGQSMKHRNKFQKITYYRILSVIIIALVMASFVSTTASAYSLTGWLIAPYKSISFKWGSNLSSPGSVIRNAWESSVTDWSSASGFTFYQYNSSVNVLNSWYESSSSNYGRYSLTYNQFYEVTTFTADINSGNTNITATNVARSVANHEFGHIAGLDDLTSGTAIMNVNRTRGTIYIPQTDDKNGIYAIYGY